MTAYLAKFVQAGRYMLAIFGFALLLMVLFVMLRIGFFLSIYVWLFAHVFMLTGLDVWMSRAVTIALLGIVWFLGWRLVLLPWTNKGRKRAVILISVIVLALIGMELATRGVYFSRPDGRPLKYYIRTLDGYAFAASPGVDPVYGIRYEPITPEVAREYLLWQKRGGNLQDPSVPEGQYFNPSTGEPIRWYARLPDGRIQMFTLPGFHSRHGIKLEPVTPAVIAEYERQVAGEGAASTKPIRPGRYLFTEQNRVGVVGRLRFRLTEVGLTADSILVHLDVENLGDKPETQRPHPYSHQVRYVIFKLVSDSGEITEPQSTRITDGALVYQDDGSMLFPPPDKQGRFVEEFPRPENIPRFSLTVNDKSLFGPINLAGAEFRLF